MHDHDLDPSSSRRPEIAKAAFEHAYRITNAVSSEGKDWDVEFTLKELAATLRDLLKRTESTDVQQQYELGLRIHALSALYLSRLLLESEVR